jgi:hypothetical protein
MYIACMCVWPLTFALIPALNAIRRAELGAGIGSGGASGAGGSFGPALGIGIAVVLLLGRIASLAYSYVPFLFLESVALI